MIRSKKKWLIFICSIAIILIGIISFISPFTKYLIQKYDEKYTGRQITMDWAYTNPFTGYIHLSNLKIYELNSDSIFLSTKGLSADFSMHKLFAQTYEINSITLTQPLAKVIQSEKKFNFDDLIQKFTPNSDSLQKPVQFNVLDIDIKDGEIYYIDNFTPMSYFIKEVDIQSSGKRWDLDTLIASYSFLAGIGNGKIKGDFSMNVDSKDYYFKILANKYDLNFIGQYLKVLTNYGTFSANLDTDVKIRGNFRDGKNISAQGLFSFNNFHFGKTTKEDYASFENLVISIKELNPLEHVFFYDYITLKKPVFIFERYDYLDNMQAMFGTEAANIENTLKDNSKFNLVIEISNYIRLISENFLQSHYKVDKLAIYDGNIEFNDYSLGEKFSIGLNPLTIISDSINTDKRRVFINFKSGIKPYGGFSGDLSINPKDSSDFDLNYNIHKIPLSVFNPYTITYTSFPLNRGTVELNGTWHVRNGNIQSENHLLVSDLRASSRLKNTYPKYIPMPLAMAFVRDGKNIIDYDIPITGDLKNPKFNLKDVFMSLLENVFVKPPTTPYRMKVKKLTTEIEESFALNWQTRQNSFLPGQEKLIKSLVDFLVENPGESITIHPLYFTDKEKEYILFYEAKKKYFLFGNKNAGLFNENDSLKVDKISIKDAQFVKYLNAQIKDSLIFTAQEKCVNLLGWSFINAKYADLIKQREEAFLYFFKKEGVERQVIFGQATSTVPYNGFSFYKIEYKGKFPEYLIEAYQKMNEIDDKENRKKNKS